MNAFLPLLFLSLSIFFFFVEPTILLVRDLRRGTCELLVVALASVALLVALTIWLPGFMVGVNSGQTRVRRVREHFLAGDFLSDDEKTFFKNHGRYGTLDEIERGGPLTQRARARMSFYLSSDQKHWCVYVPIDVPPFEFCVMFQDDRNRYGLLFDPALKGREVVPLETAYADEPFGEKLVPALTEIRRVFNLREHFVYWHRLVPMDILLGAIVVARIALRRKGVRWRPLVAADAAVLFVVWVTLLGRFLLGFV
jgi:hypothetical protein